MSTHGRIEAKLVASISWIVSGIDSVGAWGPVSVATAGATYWPSEIASLFETAINAAATDTYSVTASTGESGTGLVTIDCTAGTWSLSFTAASAQVLGFASSISGVSTAQTGTLIQAGVWLPDCPIVTARRADDAPYITDLITTTSPTGHVKTLYGNRYRALSGVSWPFISEARTTIAAESTGNESFEKFWVDSVLGAGYSEFKPGSKWRLYWDADSGTYYECRPVGFNTFDPPISVDSWRAYFRVDLPTLIEVP